MEKTKSETMRERMARIRAGQPPSNDDTEEMRVEANITLKTNNLLIPVVEEGNTSFKILGSPYRLVKTSEGSWELMKEQLEVDKGKSGDPTKEHFLVQVQKTFLQSFGVVPLARFTLFETPFYFMQVKEGMWDVIQGQARRGSSNVMISWLNWENLRGFTLKVKLPFELSVDPKDITVDPKPKGKIEFRRIVDKGKQKLELGFEPAGFEAGIKAGRAAVWKEAIEEFRRILRYIAITCADSPGGGEDDDD
jgi:hypothetical protein